jgi:hypothetical protein
MHKLQHYGIIGKSVRWTQNWLENRKQSVVIDGSTSDAGLCPSQDIPHYHLRIFPEFPAFPLSQQYITMIINMIYVY